MERLQNEMNHERRMMMDKRAQEREYLKKMLLENEANKAKAEATAQRQKEGDVQALVEYGRMLDKQEADRQHEFEQRERRAQEFMNNLASRVIQKQQHRKQAEDEQLAKYEYEREMRLRIEDERRAAREAAEKAQMRELLNRQMQEKKQREQAEKAHNDEQAMIWKRDKENYEEEERRLKRKIDAINADNCDFLKKQMDEKASRHNARRMNKEEFNFNRPLLREINQKKKDDVASQHLSQHE